MNFTECYVGVVALLARIREVPRSNIGLKRIYWSRLFMVFLSASNDTLGQQNPTTWHDCWSLYRI
jgi:hypothetical protein